MAHGFRLRDVDRLARICTKYRRTRWFDAEEAYAVAQAAIVEVLLTAQARPEESALLRVGDRAVQRATMDHQREDGVSRRNTWAGKGSAHSFVRYAASQPSASGSHEARVVEREALAQILPQLTVPQREAVEALARHYGDSTAAAAELGIARRALNARLAGARRAFYALWHEHEQAPKVGRVAASARGPAAGRTRLTAEVVEEIRARYAAGGVTTRQLAAEFGINRGTVSRLCTRKRWDVLPCTRNALA